MSNAKAKDSVEIAIFKIADEFTVSVNGIVLEDVEVSSIEIPKEGRPKVQLTLFPDMINTEFLAFGSATEHFEEIRRSQAELLSRTVDHSASLAD